MASLKRCYDNIQKDEPMGATFAYMDFDYRKVAFVIWMRTPHCDVILIDGAKASIALWLISIIDCILEHFNVFDCYI